MTDLEDFHCWVNTACAAFLIGITSDAVRAAIRREMLPAKRDEDGRWMIEYDDVVRYRDEHEVTPA